MAFYSAWLFACPSSLCLASLRRVNLNFQVGEVGKLVENCDNCVLLCNQLLGKRTSRSLCGFWGKRNWFKFLNPAAKRERKAQKTGLDWRKVVSLKEERCIWFLSINLWMFNELLASMKSGALVYKNQLQTLLSRGLQLSWNDTSAHIAR